MKTKIEPKITGNGSLFYCHALNQWFSIEAIDADPSLSLNADKTVSVVKPEDRLPVSELLFAT